MDKVTSVEGGRIETSASTAKRANLPRTPLLSPMSRKSSITSHILGYVIFTSSTSTAMRENPARPRRLDISRVSERKVRMQFIWVEERNTCHWRNVWRDPAFSIYFREL